MNLLSALSSLSQFRFEELRHILETAKSQDFIDLIDEIQSDADHIHQLSQVSYLHANGFYKFPIIDTPFLKVRIHYWTEDVESAEDIHNHRWDMISKILKGNLKQILYIKDEVNVDHHIKNFGTYRYAKTGKTLNAQSEKIDFNLIEDRELTVRENDIYSLDHKEFHRVQNQGNCITFMIQSFVKSDSNEMMVIHPDHLPDVEPKLLSQDLVIEKLKQIQNLIKESK
jgi:hypothetical protein